MKTQKDAKETPLQQSAPISFSGFRNKLTSSQQYKRDINGKFAGGTGGFAPRKKLELSRLLPTVIVTALVGGFLVFRSFAGGFNSSISPIYNLKLYYPNDSMAQSNYLEGFNYVSGKHDRSVLWFEKQDQWTYKMYNAAPQNADRRCNYDVLSWWDDQTLRYSETDHSCPGSTPNKIVYDSPIIFLPEKWDSRRPWRYDGTSKATYYEKNNSGGYQLKCSGITTYTAKIIGLENITPREQGLRWQTTQFTKWETGSVPGKCSAGYQTRWREDYWLSTTLRKDGKDSSYTGLRRTKGGNLDTTVGSWDVWYDSWYKLPSLTTQTSTVNVTPNVRNLTPR